MTTRRVSVTIERFPIAGRFTIARGSRTEAVVVVATIEADGVTGRGECVPYARYGESVEGVAAAILAETEGLAAGLDRETLRRVMPPGAARNAIDCALFDLEAKTSGRPAAEIAGIAPPRPLVTAYTLSLDTPEAMETAALAAADRPLLKVKLGGAGDPERIRAVRRGAPKARLIADANEAWTIADFAQNMAACAAADVELIEQPLPAAEDAALADLARPVPVCADESLHVGGDLGGLAGRYDAVNVKLDKAGGLTEALVLIDAAVEAGFDVMVGCMLGSSLAMAPAVLAAQKARYVDLDGPLLLAADRTPGLVYRGSLVMPPDPALWG
ncbi:N-acetyl-D-Glu racemase DgcA [Prosthecomicrobium pneumaticum]|uniref:Dipeptide epimerase n=1 Tax=Prosthecomicrobium pneumaticum TaxID=81895 RepID=A0A7W9FQL6_9HYPH|nr:L-alanine-DL-glutamate epimerase-like enolase superfamily enzyme [Prosthecomicrobium pneumaticum]